MNSRERFLTVLHAGVPDRTPLFEFFWSLPFIRSVLGDNQKSLYHNADDEVAMSRATGIDMVYTAPTPSTWTSSGRGWKNWIRPRGWLKNNFGISLGEKGVRRKGGQEPFVRSTGHRPKVGRGRWGAKGS